MHFPHMRRTTCASRRLLILLLFYFSIKDDLPITNHVYSSKPRASALGPQSTTIPEHNILPVWCLFCEIVKKLKDFLDRIGWLTQTCSADDRTNPNSATRNNIPLLKNCVTISTCSRGRGYKLFGPEINFEAMRVFTHRHCALRP